MRRSPKFLTSIMVLFLLFACVFHGYAQSGRITGRVIDQETGEPLIGVNVLLEGTTMGAATDAEGYFNIINISPGTYNIRASMIGYATQIVEDAHVHINETLTLNFELRIEAILGETVVVTAERPTVKLDVSSSRYVIDSQTVEASPVQRFDEILELFPGISLTAGDEGSGLVIRGGGLDETNIVVDGLSTRDRRTQQPNTTINLTAINEIEVLSGGFNAQYGGIRSGMINVAMKEGSLDRYSLAVDVRVSPPQQKHFGPSPYSIDGPFWQVYAGPDAFTGVTQEMVDGGKYPFAFIGWNEVARQFLADGNPETDMTPQELLEVWKWQHRAREYANKPDYVFDGTFSGKVPMLPLAFVFSQRYEDLQLAYPMSRDNSIASSTLLKLTAHPKVGMRLNFNNAYTINKGVTGGIYSSSYGMVTGTRQGNVFARNTLEKRALWNDAAYNPRETNHYRGGVALNHVLSPKTFYEVILEYENYKTEVSPIGLRDTSCVKVIGGKCYDGQPFGYISSDIGSITEQYDILDEFLMSGGGRGQDHSRYWAIGLSFDIVSQLARNNQLQAGFGIQHSLHQERREVNHGATTTPYDEAPHLWTFYDARPIEISAYVQNRLEYRDMIANVGIRLDYMHPQMRPFNLDPEFIFGELPYSNTSFRENDFSFDHLQMDKEPYQLYLSPRLGISHPLTVRSKVFFNYGHFYQPPVIDRLYEVKPSARGATIPNLTMKWPKTISYEAGFEVHAGHSILVTFTGYYKDVTNQPGRLNIVSWDRDNDISTWDNTSYADIRGVELRLQKLYGDWMFGWVALEYSARSSGYTGMRYIYEDPMLRRQQRNTISQTRSDPLPSITANITFRTPEEFGPRAFGINILGGWRLNVSQRWSRGGEVLLNPGDLYQQHQYARYIDYWNTDILLSKDFNFAQQRFGMYMQITNLFNYRGVPYTMDWNRYLDSLKFPFYEGERKGNDKIGDWKADHIDLGWYTWNQWLNPRHISFGIRANL
jgi:outer membrane receptor protein involved in Fe transport